MSTKKLSEPIYDFFKEKTWLFLVGGYSLDRGFLYIAYIVILFAVLLYLSFMAAYGAYLVAPKKTVIMDAMHVLSITLFSTWGLASRICTTRSLKQTVAMINEGIFHYSEEESDEEELKMKSEIPIEIRTKTNVFMTVFSSGLTVNMVIFPLSQVILLDYDHPLRKDPIVNPFLPPTYFFYNPFETKSFLGYCLAYFLVILLLISVYGVNSCMTEIYLTCAAQLKIHSKILNHSLDNLQKRAVRMYLRRSSVQPQDIPLDELFETKQFQKCLYWCFRANVQHHQALVRFKKACQPYCGSILLDTVTVALVCYAAGLYLILQELPVNYIICHLVLLMTEQTYTFYICYFGEEIIQESSKLFERLYDMPWFHCSKSFNLTLSIIMGYAIKPFSMKALLLDVAASLETYGDLVVAVYKIMSLVRHSDSRKE